MSVHPRCSCQVGNVAPLISVCDAHGKRWREPSIAADYQPRTAVITFELSLRNEISGFPGKRADGSYPDTLYAAVGTCALVWVRALFPLLLFMDLPLSSVCSREHTHARTRGTGRLPLGTSLFAMNRSTCLPPPPSRVISRPSSPPSSPLTLSLTFSARGSSV